MEKEKSITLPELIGDRKKLVKLAVLSAVNGMLVLIGTYDAMAWFGAFSISCIPAYPYYLPVLLAAAFVIVTAVILLTASWLRTLRARKTYVTDLLVSAVCFLIGLVLCFCVVMAADATVGVFDDDLYAWLP